MSLTVVFFYRLHSLCNGVWSGCGERINQDKYLRSLNDNEATLIDKFKEKIVDSVRGALPSPHSELVLGMTLGIDKFEELPIFSEMLRRTGTIHVVVVSGYNVTLVFTFVISILGSLYHRRNFLLAICGTLFYAFISGFDPPVIRAWMMGGVLMLGKYYGLRLNVLLVLVFTALVLLCLDPGYVFSLSYKLSFVATLSLVLFDEYIFEDVTSRNTLILDLKSTLAAQILIWPVISFYFGQVSLLSPIVNTLVLWTVPLSTVIGSIYVLLSFLPIKFISYFLSWMLYFPLDVFVRVVELFSTISFVSIDYQIGVHALIVYYLIVFGYVWWRKSR